MDCLLDFVLILSYFKRRGGPIIKTAIANKLVICFILVLFPHSAFTQTEYEKFIDEVQGFSIVYVSQWKVVKSKFSDGGTNFLDVSNQPPLVAVNVNKVKSNQSLENVSQSAKKYVSEQPGVSEVSILSENVITASQMQGIENIMTYKVDGNEVFVKSAYLTNAGYIISITMAGSAKTIEEMQSSFKHMIENIEFL